MLYIIEWLLLILSTSLPSLDIKFEKCSDAIFGYSEGNGGRYGRYDLSMSYDDLWRVTSKSLDLWRHTASHSPRQYAGYSLSYGYGTDDGTRFRLSTIAETHYRVENDTVGARRQTFHRYQYDGSGNLTHEESGHPVAGGAVNWKSGERKLLWDAENRLKALDENGYVSTYVYDADGERVVKQHGGNRGLYVNSAGRDSLTETTAFTLYVNPYVTWTEGGKYVKHVYMGGSRVASRLGVAHLMGNNPIAALNGNLQEYSVLDSTQKAVIVTMYGTFGIPYGGEDRTAVLPYSNEPGNFLGDFTDPGGLEGRQYFYHPDHLGSSTVITDGDGNVVQHIEYMPYGEVFMEEDNETWNTPYKFNGKEYDGETGLYYYGARYLDPKLCIWYGADPKENDYPSISTYCYTLGNPVKTIDPDGNSPLTKFVKAGMKISAKVGKDGIKALGQASTYTQAVSDISNDINTLFDSNSTVGERVIAGASIVSEALPISLNDAKSIAKSGKRFLNKLSERTIGNTKKPYSKSRPKYGKGQVENVWNNAKESEGKVYDPNIGIELHWDITKPRKGQWDMGHKPDAKYSDLHRDCMDGKITKEEFLHRYRDPNNYRPELPINNRSHKYE